MAVERIKTNFYVFLRDDKGNRFSIIEFNNGGEYLQYFMSQCVKANYNVTEDIVNKFHWGGIEWDYLQPILIHDCNEDPTIMVGVRMIISRSFYLNPFYQVQDLLNNKDLLQQHIESNVRGWTLDEKCNFHVEYEKFNTGYRIILDIHDKYYNRKFFYAVDNKLLAN